MEILEITAVCLIGFSGFGIDQDKNLHVKETMNKGKKEHRAINRGLIAELH